MAAVVLAVSGCQSRSSVPTTGSSSPPAATTSAAVVAPVASSVAPVVTVTPSAVPAPSASAAAPKMAPLVLSKDPKARGLLAVRDGARCKSIGNCALTPQGKVVCFSNASAHWMTLSDVVQIDASQDFHCALDKQGKVSCWGGDECQKDGPALDAQPFVHKLGPIAKVLASGWKICLEPRKGRGECQEPKYVEHEPPTSVARGLRAITGGGCMLLATGIVRCDFGIPREGHPRVGLVVFPGVFRDLAEGGFNPGYYGVQHCAIDQAGAVACCKTLLDCKKHVFERKTFPSPATELVGANGYVATRLENGDVYAWKSTIRRSHVPFAHEPTGHVSAFGKTLEIAGGGSVLCARLEDGKVACIGGEFGKEAAAIVKVPAP